MPSAITFTVALPTWSHKVASTAWVTVGPNVVFPTWVWANTVVDQVGRLGSVVFGGAVHRKDLAY